MAISQKINNFLNNPQNFTYLILGIYFSIITGLIFKSGIVLGLDVVFILFFFAALFIGKWKFFLKDWFPFLLMFFAYEAMRGIADNLAKSVHIWEMIRADHFLFGQLPNVFLQTHLWKDGSLFWYDIAGFFFYLSHFWFVFLVGFIIWLKKRDYFRAFSWSFLILCGFGFITYLLFPAMPPWMASSYGYIGEVERLLLEVGRGLNLGAALTVFYAWIGPNEVAAMPSLHMAWSWFASLFLIHIFGKKLLPIFIMPLGLGFSLVYFAEHYVIDLIVGIFYAFFAFFIGKKFFLKKHLLTES